MLAKKVFLWYKQAFLIKKMYQSIGYQMDIDTQDNQSNKPLEAISHFEKKKTKSQHLLKNPTVLLSLTAIAICFSTCSYSVALSTFNKRTPLSKQNNLLIKLTSEFERDLH